MANVKRKMVKERVNESIHAMFPSSLKNLRSYVDSMIDRYGEDAHVKLNYGYEGEVYDFDIVYERLETEKEANKRILAAEKSRARREARLLKQEENERKELARLMKKYG